MFRITSLKSPVVFASETRNRHHISVVVNGSVVSEDPKGRAKTADESETRTARLEGGGGSGVDVTEVAASVQSSLSAVAGTTSIRVTEDINRSNQDRQQQEEQEEEARAVHIRHSESGGVSFCTESWGETRPVHPNPSEGRNTFLSAVPGASCHHSRLDEEAIGLRVNVSPSSTYQASIVSVSPATSVVKMVPGALNRDKEAGVELRDGDQVKSSQLIAVKRNNAVSAAEWLKNEMNLVPNLEDAQDSSLGLGADSPHDDELTPDGDSDVLAEGIKLRVSFGNHQDQEQLVSRSPDDGYHDDDTLSEEESSGHHRPVVINETVPSANDGIHVAIPVRLSDTNSTNYDRELRFIKVHHVGHDIDVFEDDANSSLGSDTGTILSRRGTIRGMKNHVRSSIAAFLENMATKRQYGKEENGRVVLYTTTMGVVRRTHDLCRRTRNIMYTLMIRFEERDVFMNRLYQTEVCERLHLDEVIVPQLFVDGVHVGDADVIERLNETGELRKLLEPYKRQSMGSVCQMCGDFRFLPCTTCGGSKKSLQHRHQFSEEIVALRCMVCDENGLIRCTICLNDDQR